jgi:uncharacterized protein
MNVVVLGASDNPTRYSYIAVRKLKLAGHTVYPVGIKNATVEGLQIITKRDPLENIDIITVYVGQVNQPGWYDFILKTNPRKIILNPGAENGELTELAENLGIEVVEECTLVMLHYNAL